MLIGATAVILIMAANTAFAAIGDAVGVVPPLLDHHKTGYQYTVDAHSTDPYATH